MEQYYSARALEYQATASYAAPQFLTLTAPIKARYRLAFEGRDVLEIACGPGFWTEMVACTARTVMATDRDAGLISMVRTRLSTSTNVSCSIADAYQLRRVVGTFTGAFANFWWSHIPKSRLKSFLVGLHSKLVPGSPVMFLDTLAYRRPHQRRCEGGDVLEERVLQNGHRFVIIKNFPSKYDVVSALEGLADGLEYRCYAADGYWTVCYRSRPISDGAFQ
jgi:demethylmenaquinone methyltransferase/2-methoxy-6-polyprenyl-1,4-benzoquinol methylase